MMARCALLLIDGLDEGGGSRDAIERHIAEVLAPQGHVMLCTSRPTGINDARYAGFRRLRLAPLTEAQQYDALTQRLGAAGVQTLMPFLERVPTDTGTQQRVTSNPLMLSMVASVFEIRQGVGMPETIPELYESASDAMLARGGVVSEAVRTLLEAVFFEAQVKEARVITEVHLYRAALDVFAPKGTLVEIDRQANSEAELLSSLATLVEALPLEAREAVRAVRERVAQDSLPLLSLLQIEPLQMQSSHLSFQEYFAARAICTSDYRLPEGSPPPWQWSPSWANTVKLGGEMGAAFGEGLVQTAGLDKAIDLKGKLGGDRPTAVAAVAQLMRGLTSIDLSNNKLGPQDAEGIAEGIYGSGSLTQVLAFLSAITLSTCLSHCPLALHATDQPSRQWHRRLL